MLRITRDVNMDNDTVVLPTLAASSQADLLPVIEPPSPSLQSLITTFYTAIFVTGILGNGLTCVVITFNSFMQTSTNYYLFNLAISDLLIIIFGLPLEVYRIWRPDISPLNDLECVLFGLISETAANVTVLTITAFTIERYIAVCRPFLARKHQMPSRAVKHIMAIWVTGTCAAIPQAMQFGIVKDFENTSVTCTVKGEGMHQVYVSSSVVFFVMPTVVITVLYAKIILKLRKSGSFKDLVESPEGSIMSSPRTVFDRRRTLAAQGRIVKMLGK